MVYHEDQPAHGIVVLAAGLGRRMRSSLPKVLHELGGKPIIYYILNQIREVSPQVPVALVVGYGRDQVEDFVKKEPSLKGMNLTWIVQAEQLGTGHAAKCAMESSWGEEQIRRKATILVLPGDLPLISSDLVRQMLEPLRKTEILRLLTCEFPDPTGYGRVVRRARGGPVIRIAEEKDATPKEKAIREVATSIYLFRSDFLKASLRRLSNANAQREYYLTDLIELATRARRKIGVLLWGESEDLRGINDPWEMAQATKLLNERSVRRWSLAGVKFQDPWRTWVDSTVQLAPGVFVSAGAMLFGTTRIGENAQIGPNVVLKDMDIGERAQIKTGTVAECSKIGAEAIVGPYAHLRPESFVGKKCKIGNFVELKKTKVGDGSSVAHLSYLGDADVGKNVNIGCGFVTCNFDGRVIEGQRKHRTIIEDDVFMGSDCQAIAPVKIGKGAYVASGSTITDDVDAGALAIARSRQVNKPGYAQKLKQSPKED